MKTIYLVRHSKAEKGKGDSPDIKRRLSKNGKKEARRLAKKLRKGGFTPDFLLSSSARRTVDTARIFAKVFQHSKKNIVLSETLYTGSELPVHQEFLEIVHGFDDRYQSVMIFGHEPKISEFASFLRRDFSELMPTCAVACFDIRNNSWAKVTKGRGILKFVDYRNREKRLLAAKTRNLKAKIADQLTKIFVGTDPENGLKMEKAAKKAGQQLAKRFFDASKPAKQKNQRAETQVPSQKRGA